MRTRIRDQASAARPAGGAQIRTASSAESIDLGGVSHVRKAERPAFEPARKADPVPQRSGPLRLFRGHLHRLAALALAEAGIVAAAVYLAALVRFPEASLGGMEAILGPVWPRALLAIAVMFVCLASMGLYQLRQRAEFAGVAARLLVAGAMAQVALLLAFHALPAIDLGRGALFIAGALAMPVLALARLGFLRLVDQDVFKRPVLVWGCGERAASIAHRLRRRADRRGFRILGYVQAPGEAPSVPAESRLQAGRDLMRFVVDNRIEEVVVAMEDRRQGFPESFLRQCREQGIVVRDIVRFLEDESGHVNVDLAHPSWLIFSGGFRNDRLRMAGKRALDVAVALAVLAVGAPIALATALAIYLEDRGPVLYRQVRTGQHGRPFTMLKFRSMSVNAEAAGAPVWACANDQRVTRVGAFIRKVRIDELPQVVNVLLGQMSFVGPRPERPAFVESLSRAIPFYAERHLVKPGITGWAQVSYPYGSSESDAREKLGYDLYYVKNCNVLFDLVVLLRTAEIVLFRVGSR